MEPVPNMITKIATDGCLELVVPSMDTRLVYNSVGTAMWVVLCLHKWNIFEAARALSTAWETDFGSVYSQMQDWVVDLFSEGVLCV